MAILRNNPREKERRGTITSKGNSKYFLVIEVWSNQANNFKNDSFLRLKGTRKQAISILMSQGISRNRILTPSEVKREDEMIRQRRFKLDIEIRKALRKKR